MVTADNISEWMESPDKLNRESLYELRSLVAKYPYFQSARLLLLETLYLLRDEDFGGELGRAAFYVMDRRVLYNMVESGSSLGVNSSGKKSPHLTLSAKDKVEIQIGLDRTLSLIDDFLEDTFEENQVLEYEGISTDYLSNYPVEYSLDDVSENRVERLDKRISQQEDLIDLFIKNGPSALNPALESELPDQEDEIGYETYHDSALEGEETGASTENDFFTETLASIYIKQKRYDKALEIIRLLYLKFPNKNVYFADQIRYLEKLLLINQK